FLIGPTFLTSVIGHIRGNPIWSIGATSVIFALITLVKIFDAFHQNGFTLARNIVGILLLPVMIIGLHLRKRWARYTAAGGLLLIAIKVAFISYAEWQEQPSYMFKLQVVILIGTVFTIFLLSCGLSLFRSEAVSQFFLSDHSKGSISGTG